MKISAKEIAVLVNGIIEGDENVLVDKPSKIEEGTPGTITFLANAKYEPFLYSTSASIILLNKEFHLKEKIDATIIRVDDAYQSITILLETFNDLINKVESVSIQNSTAIDDSVILEDHVSIGHFTVIEPKVEIGTNSVIGSQVFIGQNSIIGNNTTIGPGVKIYQGTVIGNNCFIHANSVIGSDGFGFVPTKENTYKKIPQIGNVIIEDNVEIGANTVIDRATMGSTLIQQGSKLDNLIQVAHNVVIGKNTAIAAQTGIAGSSKIGDNCLIGGQVGISGHLSIANKTQIQAQSGLIKSIKEVGTAVYGSPAMPFNKFLRSFSVFKILPDLKKAVEKMEVIIDKSNHNK